MMKHINSDLRPVNKEDLPALLVWRNHPDVRRFMYTQHVITLEEHLSWFEKVSQNPKQHLMLYCENQQPLAFCQFTVYQHLAEWGFYLSPDAPAGTGTRLGKSALDYAFGVQSWHRICGEALSYNHQSIRFHRKLGFTEEGRLREHVEIDAKYYDVLCFGLLKSEWHRKREEL